MDDLTTEESRVITEIVPATPLPRLHDHTMPADGGQASSVLAQKMSEFLEYMEVEKGSSKLTIRNYKHYLKRFHDWMVENKHKLEPETIDQEIVRQYRVALSRLEDGKGGTLARKTQGYHAIALRSFLRWLLKNDFEVLSPDKIDLPKIEDRQVKFLNAEQIERLLTAPTLSKIQGKRDKAIMEVLFSTGLRVSELTRLDRDKVDLDRREFGVLGKGGKARVVFLSERATDWLRNYLRAREDQYGPLFIRHKGKVEVIDSDEDVRLTVRSVQRMIKKYSQKMKLPVDVTPHVMRHSFATDLLIAGADLRSVQEMLGHKNVATTQIYTHVTHKHLKDIHDSFHGRGK